MATLVIISANMLITTSALEELLKAPISDDHTSLSFAGPRLAYQLYRSHVQNILAFVPKLSRMSLSTKKLRFWSDTTSVPIVNKTADKREHLSGSAIKFSTLDKM